MSTEEYYFNDPKKYLHKVFGTRIRAEIVREFLGDISGTKILDLGCGDGSITMQFVKDNNITFVDLSENMLLLAKDAAGPGKANCRFIHSTVTELPFQHEFDIVVAIGLLAHLDSVEEAIGKIKKYVKKGGYIVLQFSDQSNPLTKLNIAISSRHYNRKITGMSYASVIDICKRNDLNVLKQIKYAFMLPGMGKLPDGLLYRIQRSTTKNKLFRFLYTDHMLMLQA